MSYFYFPFNPGQKNYILWLKVYTILLPIIWLKRIYIPNKIFYIPKIIKNLIINIVWISPVNPQIISQDYRKARCSMELLQSTPTKNAKVPANDVMQE